MGQGEMINWHKLTQEDFPPVGLVLLWVDYRHGGFAVVGHVMPDKRIWWWSFDGMNTLHPLEYRRTRWAEITPPEGEIER